MDRVGLVIVIVSGACTLRPYDPGESATAGNSSSGASPTMTSVTSTETAEPTGSTGGATDSGGSGAATSSTTSDTGGAPGRVCCDRGGCVGPLGADCTVWWQDCPEGQKCVPVPECGTGAWIAEKCMPVMEMPAQIGEDCVSLGGGVDNCAQGAFCWHATEDHPGVCVPLCHPPQDAPTCDDPELLCAVDSGLSTLGWCFAPCDPLTDSCPRSDENCTRPSTPTGNFICWPIWTPDGVKPGGVHDACDGIESCDKGLVCVSPWAAKECPPNSIGCCEPYCDLSVPDPDAQCPGVGQTCHPYFNEGEAPAGQEDVGVCAVPL